MIRTILLGTALTVCWIGAADAQKKTHAQDAAEKGTCRERQQCPPNTVWQVNQCVAPGSDPEHSGEIVCKNIPKEPHYLPPLTPKIDPAGQREPESKTWIDGNGKPQQISNRDVFFDPKTRLSFAFPHKIQDFADGFDCYFQRSTVRVEWQKSADGINSYRAFAKCSEKGGSYRTKQIEGRMVQ